MTQIKRNIAVSIVSSDDAEEFAADLGKAVAKAAGVEGPPSVSFSHTANGSGGYNYAAVVTGWIDPAAEVTVTTLDN